MTWKIEDEILKLSGKDRISDALMALRMVSSSTAEVQVRTTSEWQRGGAETYFVPFVLETHSRLLGAYILKAMTAATPGTPPETQLRNWTTRRGLVESAGASVPRLYAASNGVLLEDYIAHDLVAFRKDQRSPHVIDDSVIAMSESVWAAGFKPTSWLHNMRTDGRLVYWVDFGEDLGDSTGRDPGLDYRPALYSEWRRLIGEPPYQILSARTSK